MALSRGNPISVEVLEAVPVRDIDGEIKKQVEGLVHDIRRVDQDNIGWLRKQADLVKLRRGNRRARTIPWKGASNVSIPLIDGVIRRWRPGIAALVLDADPVAFFTAQSPDDFEASRTVEPMFTYLFREAMDTTNQVVQLVDLIAARGHAYSREAWAYRTRRQARIISADHLFPGGIEEEVGALVQQAAQAGQQVDPVEVVMLRIAEEYDMDPQDPSESPVLVEAAQKLLEGAEFVKITFRSVIIDRPDWKAIDPINVIVPQDQDPEHADFFCMIHELTPDDLRALAIDRHLRPSQVEAVLRSDPPLDPGVASSRDAGGMRQEIRDLMDRRAGIATSRGRRTSVGLHVVWEIYCHLDIDGDGERERCLLWYAPESDTMLGILDYPYPFGGWPITYYPFEAAARPVDNRGLADMLRSYQKIVNAFHNARLDAAQIVLAPVMLKRITAGNMKSAIKWRPGAVIPVTNPGDVQIMQKAGEGLGILNGLLQEEQVNQRLAEAYVGVFDAALTNIQQSKERRTAAEIQAITNLSGNIFGLDARIFTTAMSKSFTKIWQLYQDLGPDEVFFRVTGEQMPRIARKSEISKNYDIRAAGTPANTNRSFQIQSLERVMQVMLNPLVLQSGRIDFGTIFDSWLQLVDYNLAKRVIRPPEEAAAVQRILQASQTLQAQQGGPTQPEAF